MTPLARTNPLHRRATFRAVVSAWERRTAVGCSGGVDSTALLLIATEARNRGRIEPFVCLHVDHLTRPASTDDALVVSCACAALRVPFVRLTVDGKEQGGVRATEDELRVARYRALSKRVRPLGIDAVATAHTRDDQVETVLMRLLSGAGPMAAAGMQEVQLLTFEGDEIRVVRPLLEATRAELLEIVRDAGVTTVEDPSNADVSYRRNRLRSRIVPEIAAAFPGFDGALLRSVALARHDAELLDAMARNAANDDEIVVRLDDRVSIDRSWLRHAHPALSSRVIRLALAALNTGDARALTRERTEIVRVAAAGRTGARIELPGGLIAIIRSNSVDIETKGATSD
ncbi:MAG TPA: tRNA lysidine(34) synthetase TilS [Thermomicrobiales bacterium]|nr:tRNA lysidine(34) synthetase TilS [Thermomicrobiales bacterium]